MSIRTRLTWAYALGSVATLGLVGVLVWWQMSDALVQSVDTALQTQLSATLTSLENQGQAGLQDSDLTVTGIWTVLYDPFLRRIDATTGAPHDVPAKTGVSRIGSRQYLIRVTTAEDGTIVVTGADLAPVLESQAALARILLGVGLSVGALSLLGGWVLAGRALRPIDRLVEEAEGLGPGELDRRLALSGQMDEVGRLTLTLNRMLDRISDSVARQRLFVAMASHELRTPLAALRAELDLMDGAEEPSLSEYRNAIGAARADAVRLTTLTAALLELATAADEAIPLARTAVAIPEMARSAVRSVAPLVDETGAKLSIQVPDLEAWVDRTRIEQALVNLISNALLHSGGSPVVEVKGEVSGEDPPWLTLAVLDRGPGFGGDDPADLFTPFRRGAGSTAAGSGLGLAIVAATARAHGGNFGAHDRPGGGAAVWLKVPLMNAAGLAAATPTGR